MQQQLLSFKKLQKLRNFKGEKQEFWNLFLDLMATVSDARAGVVALKDNQGEWRTITYFPESSEGRSYIKVFLDHIETLQDSVKDNNQGIYQGEDYTLLAVPVLIESGDREALGVFYLDKIEKKEASKYLNLLSTLRDVSAHYRIRNAVDDSLKYKKRISEILDFLVLLKEKKKFLAAGMTFL